MNNPEKFDIEVSIDRLLKGFLGNLNTEKANVHAIKNIVAPFFKIDPSTIKYSTWWNIMPFKEKCLWFLLNRRPFKNYGPRLREKYEGRHCEYLYGQGVNNHVPKFLHRNPKWILKFSLKIKTFDVEINL